MKNFWQKIPQPILVLAPMAGYTESPFRSMVRELEPSVILVSELISAEAIRRKNKKTFEMMRFSEMERKYFGIQLFGSKHESFVEAAKIVESEVGADFIDLNFGCPSPKVIKSESGSAILKDPKSAVQLIESIVKNIKIPVTVKMRLGFFNDDNFLEIVKSFEEAGVSAIAIHGRTTTQRFFGVSNWEKIYEAKKLLKIPVIGNGDIKSAIEARDKLKNLDGIMIGRGAIANPWIFRESRALFDNGKILDPPKLKIKVGFLRELLYRSLESKDEKYAVLELRKFVIVAIYGFDGAKTFREKLMKANSLETVENVFDEIESLGL
jgi:nifR3 family TIM-barrel protein